MHWAFILSPWKSGGGLLLVLGTRLSACWYGIHSASTNPLHDHTVVSRRQTLARPSSLWESGYGTNCTVALFEARHNSRITHVNHSIHLHLHYQLYCIISCTIIIMQGWFVGLRIKAKRGFCRQKSALWPCATVCSFQGRPDNINLGFCASQFLPSATQLYCSWALFCRSWKTVVSSASNNGLYGVLVRFSLSQWLYLFHE